ncbi:hypothetical protein HWC35_gp207 [Vibrio phage USC-1]|uniref:Uncharacterized protein n=2 Tax=Aphroditevirus USC1 TaxID=2846605 RepID=A0A514A2W0_9CAUD|nr:hypothetical protein HWC35_gp207 [Vibrio phage USC-1]QCW23126.1 hypothetical protein [Vibrio phage 5 TSL-2019]QDH47601.1 hypothetical protein [Vibrio phage USC-1]
MFIVLQELADRFIESVVPKVQGETYEEKIRVVLRWAIFYSTIVTWLLFGLGIQYTHTLLKKQEWKETSAVIQQIFAVEDNPLKSFVTINRGLTARLETIQDEHIAILKERAVLARDNERLTRENIQLKRLIESKQCSIQNEKP